MRGHRVRALLCGCLSLAGCACAAATVGERAASEPNMDPVSRGRFTMGWDDGLINEQPAHAVRLDEFEIDRYEVSAREFVEFLNAEGNPEERFFTANEHATVALLAPVGDSRQRYAARAGYEKHPANGVSWYGADAYCRWRGKRLPTEAEWEKAARGKDRRLYPWGDKPPDESRARFGQLWERAQFGVLVPVDGLPRGASPYGPLNMSGNVLEWVSDWYRQNYCDFCNPTREPNLSLVRQLAEAAALPSDPGPAGASAAGQDPPRENPTGPSAGAFKVLRGGSWQDRSAEELSATHRFWLDPAQRSPATGFRCVK